MSRRVELALALLLALAVAVAVVAGRRSGGTVPSLDYRTSTYLSGPRGSRALYDVLARVGVRVERRRTPLFDVARRPGRRPAVLAILDPPVRLLPAELAQVVRFVRSGGAVVVAGGGGGITRCLGWRTANVGRRFAPDSFPVVSLEPGLVLPPVTDFLKPSGAKEADEPSRRLGLGEESADDECRTVTPEHRDVLLRLADGRPAALRLRYPGGGSVMLMADAGYFRNRAWRSSDVPYFLAPFLTPARRGKLVWDEYHQGFGREESLTGALLAWLTDTPGGWAILQLAGVILVGLAVAAVRFGPARPVLERRRRSPLEHLEALAAGLEGAVGVDAAVALIVSGLQRRLGRTGVLRPEEQRSWLAALELALPTPAGRGAVRRLQRIATQPGGAERVLAVAQAVEDAWQELRPLKTRTAS